MANFCGGIKLNSNTFKIEKGIITLSDVHSDDPLTETTTPCAQLWDAIIFETVKLDGKHPVITSAGVDTDIPMGQPIKSNCGIYLDPRFFTITNGVVDFTERHLLEVLVNPADVEYTIQVSLTTTPEMPVEPLDGFTNVFPMDNIDEQYSITVTAEGYNQFTTDVTANSDQIVQAELTPSAD